MNTPECFEKVKGVVTKLVEDNVPILINKLKWYRYDNILDYGCGCGSVTNGYIYPIAEKYFSAVTSVDVSRQVVEFAEKKFASANPRVTFVVGNILKKDEWPLEFTKFDKIFSIHSLLFVQDYAGFLNRLCSQLASEGGQLALSTPYGRFFRIHHDMSDSPRWIRYMKATKHLRASWPYDTKVDFPTSVKSVLESLGMKITHFCFFQTTYSFNDVIEFIDFIMATNVGVTKVPLELQQELREDIGIRGSILSQIPLSSKPFVIKLNYLRLIAEK